MFRRVIEGGGEATLTCTMFQYGTTLARLSVTSEHAEPSSITIRVECCVYRA